MPNHLTRPFLLPVTVNIMPYELEKVKGGYYVTGPSGRKSKHPLSKDKAIAQMRALYANEPKASSAGAVLADYKRKKQSSA